MLFCRFITGILGIVTLTNCNYANNKMVKSQAIDSVYFAGQLPRTDTIIKHTFFIKNTGNANLLIDSIGGSCSCIDIKWDRKPIKPGERGFINVTVQSDTTEKGKKMQYVIAKTNSITPLSVFKIFFSR